MRLADRVVYMDSGRILRDGPSEEVLAELMAKS